MAKKKPIKKEIDIENIKKKEISKNKIKEVDVMVPVHFIDGNYFGANVQSWFDELPVRRILVGCNNPNKKEYEGIKDFLSEYDKIEFIDQRGIKTLGFQITDLMKRMETVFFCYCHADAQPTRHSFLVLEAEIDTKDEDDDRPVGIIESERVSYNYTAPKQYPDVYPHNYYRNRSFSGYQLIRKEAIESILDKIEDDHVYRNEDIIFQNVCENNGFRYVKSFGMHVHTTSSKANDRWTPQGIELEYHEARKITFDMQIKGIVKYCTPDEVTKIAWRDGFGQCIRENNADLFGFIEDFVKKENPEWEEAIKEIIMDLIVGFYR